MEETKKIVPDEEIISKIIVIRNKKVMIDSDLAELYGVTTKRLNEQVSRNVRRFPDDFMFRLTEQEKKEVVAICDHLKHLKYSPYLPYVFTEYGAVMLASILNSEKAVLTNIQIVRIFIKMRQLLENHNEILQQFVLLHRKENEQDQQIHLIFEYLNQLEQKKTEESELQERRRSGFRRNDES
jgi:hypothetical protein